MTVSYVREDDQKLMEGIQQLLNRLNGGNVEITDQMVRDALALIKDRFQISAAKKIYVELRRLNMRGHKPSESALWSTFILICKTF